MGQIVFVSPNILGLEFMETVSENILMAKKKSVPKKKLAPKKTPKKDDTEKKQAPQEFEIKPLTKTDYVFGMIKRAFGYE